MVPMWGALDVGAEPLGFTPRPDGAHRRRGRRVVRDLDGRLLDERRSVDVYVLAAGLVARME